MTWPILRCSGNFLPFAQANRSIPAHATHHNAEALGTSEVSGREAAGGHVRMLYLMRDAYDQMLSPMRVAAEMARTACENPFSPLSYAPNSRAVAASCELFERATR